jgi:hypothetical protein
MNQIKTGAGGEIYSNSEADELSKHYGLDIVEQLQSMMSAEISRGINKDIIKKLGWEPDRNKRRMNSINKIFFKNVE